MFDNLPSLFSIDHTSENELNNGTVNSRRIRRFLKKDVLLSGNAPQIVRGLSRYQLKYVRPEVSELDTRTLNVLPHMYNTLKTTCRLYVKKGSYLVARPLLNSSTHLRGRFAQVQFSYN
jgi:hypothetical protein